MTLRRKTFFSPKLALRSSLFAAACALGVGVCDLLNGAEEPPTLGETPFPTSDGAFPTVGGDFPVVDAPLAPPVESELPAFMLGGGADVPEPTEAAPGSSSSFASEDDRRRESISNRAETERKLEANYNAWLKKQRSKQKSLEKTPEYLRPLPNDREIFNDPTSPFSRTSIDGANALNSKEKDDFIRQITAADLSLMADTNAPETSRELLDWEKDELTPINWSKYALTIERIRDWLGMGPDERKALEYMRRACEKQNEYAQTKEPKRLKEAALLYERAARAWPGSALEKLYGAPASEIDERDPKDESDANSALIEEDGLFYAGECWFFYKNYNRALHCYKALVSTYNASVYKKTATRRLYSIGRYWVEVSERNSAPSINVTDKDKPTFSSFAGAEEAFKTIYLNDASDSGLAPAALFALANAYMRRGVNQGDGAFDKAARYYKQLYEFYPASQHAEDACLMAMIALHKSYQGPFYDETPLNEARQIAETALKSGKVKNIDVVNEELDNIKEEQARHLLAAGQYYEKRGNFASARSYYNRLVREHPNSDYASEGARAYENIEERPAEADQFSWIRPIAPFLPKPKREYFEEAPDASLSKIARRDANLDQIGRKSPFDDGGSAAPRENMATDPDAPKRY